jgi:hypothetical protein
VDEEFLILPNGQVAAQQKLTRPRPPALAPLRKSRSLSPKRSGLLGKLCGRFKSPSKKGKREKANLNQAAAIAAYRDTYGSTPFLTTLLYTRYLNYFLRFPSIVR